MHSLLTTLFLAFQNGSDDRKTYKDLEKKIEYGGINLEKIPEVVERKGLTIRVLIVGLAMVAITTAYFNLFLRSGTGGVPWGPEFALDFMRHQTPGISTDHMILRNSTSWPITLGFFMTINILGAYLLKLTKGKTVISIELLVLSTMIATSFFYFWPNGPNCEWGRDASSWGGVATGLSLYQGKASRETWAILPNIICPNDPAVYEAIVPVRYGWAIHPAFYPSIVWSILFWGSNTFFFVFLGMICKILWFDVESIPPTWVELQHQSLMLVSHLDESSTKTESSGRLSGRLIWFLIGFLISAVFTILEYGYTLAKDISDVTTLVSFARNGYLFGTDIPIAPMFDISRLGIIPWVPLLLSFYPYQIGFAFVLPLDLLYSVALGFLIFNAMIPVSFTSVGLLPPFTPGRDYRSVFGRFINDSFVGVDGVNAWTNGLYTCTIQGLLIGLFIYPFIRYRERTIPLFKAIYSKADERLEALSPIPLRYVWIGLIVSAIIWFASWAATGAYMPVVIASLLVQTLMIGGSVRAGMYTAGINFMNDFAGNGGSYRSFWMAPSAYLTLKGAPTPSPNTSSWATFMATLRSQAFNGWMNNQSQNMAWSLYNIKLGELFKVRRRDMGWALILSFIVIFLFSAPFYALRYHVWPWGPEGIGEAGDKYVIYDTFEDPLANFKQGLWYDDPSVVRRLAKLGTMGGVQYIGYVALGFALVPLLIYLRRRVSWFRILPEGILLGLLAGDSFIIGPIILALILKWVIFKAGLVEAYREKLYPACMGLVMGFFIPWTIMFMVVAFYTSPATILWSLSRARG